MTRVLSCIQPTGDVHLGNYLGALRNWVAGQHEKDVFHGIVDLHAITVEYDPAEFARERREAAKVLMACGVDPERSLFFYQSQVPQHTELAWILGSITGGTSDLLQGGRLLWERGVQDNGAIIQVQ